MLRKTTIERFTEKYLIVPSGCWEWQAARDSWNYSLFWYGGRQGSGHRWSYEHFIGPIPEGLTIDHLCCNPSCVNPEHLEAVTMRENILRSQSWGGANARKTHCIRGHAYDDVNTEVRPNGKRRCLACRAEDNERDRLSQRKRRAA